MTKFNENMTVAEAQSLHPRAREVFTGYHLGGCSHCAISEFEDIKTVCEGYGVPVDAILSSLESLFEEKESEGMTCSGMGQLETKEAIKELENGKSEKFVDTNALLSDLNK